MMPMIKLIERDFRERKQTDEQIDILFGVLYRMNMMIPTNKHPDEFINELLEEAKLDLGTEP